MLTEGEEDRLPLKKIYDRYELWCLDRNIKPLKKACLSAEIELRTGIVCDKISVRNGLVC